MSKLNTLEITDDSDNVLCRVLSGQGWPEGIHFHTADSSNIQVATMRYDEGHHMKSHKHNIYVREATRTNEVFVVLQGRVQATIFNEDNEVVEFVILSAGDIAIFLAGGHSFDVIDDDTRIVEVKNGPYYGVEKDKTWFKHHPDD